MPAPPGKPVLLEVCGTGGFPPLRRLLGDGNASGELVPVAGAVVVA